MTINLNKTEIVFNKTLYIGIAYLEISKTSIYDFHYNFMIHCFSSRSKFLFVDTDRLIYDTFGNDIYDEINQPHIHKFYTSNYSPNNPYDVLLLSKKFAGLMKDDTSGSLMTFLVG